MKQELTFTTLIDHFTSYVCFCSTVYSNQLIKLELRTQSIRQQKLPPHSAENRHSTRLSVWPWLRLWHSGRHLASDISTIQLRRFILTTFSLYVNNNFHIFRAFPRGGSVSDLPQRQPVCGRGEARTVPLARREYRRHVLRRAAVRADLQKRPRDDARHVV